MLRWALFAACLCYPGVSGQYQDYELFIVHESSGVNGTVYKSVDKCDAVAAGFGGELGDDVGYGIATHPQDACSHLDPAPDNGFNSNETDFDVLWFAVIPRKNCTFATKVLEAQKARYQAAIIYNYEGEEPIQMGGQPHDVAIPSVMISYSCAQRILNKYPYKKGYVLTARQRRPSFIFIKYLIPFLCVVAFCFIIMIGAMTYKLVRERRRRHRRRLSRSNLRKIPTKKYKKASGEEAETCPICLDDFEDGEKLRVLPCKHAYHTKCVDPWLTKNRKVCPVCKRKVVPSSGNSSDSEEESPPAPTPHNESAPLILSPQQVGNSTFYGYPGAASSSQTDPSPPPDPQARGGRFVVPGFLRGAPRRVVGESRERLVVPVPSDNSTGEDGVDNPGFEQVTLHPQPQRHRRRRRHPAANAGQAPETTIAGLDLDESNDEGEGAEGAVCPSRTAPSSEFKGGKEGGDKKKKKKRRDLMKEKREKRSRKVTPQSAPASLRDPSMDEESQDEVVEIPKGLAREDSIQLDLDEPGDDTQGLVDREHLPAPSSSAYYADIV